MHTPRTVSSITREQLPYYAPTLGLKLNADAWAPRGAFSLVLMIGEVEQRHRFAYALRKAMDVRGVSGRALARALEIDPRKVTSWLTEKGLPNLYESQALARALKVDEDLFRNPPEVPPPPPEQVLRMLEWLAPLTTGSVRDGSRFLRGIA